MTGGTGGMAKFYTAAVTDGAPWVQLGADVPISFPTSALWTVAAGAFWEVGGGGWQPAGTPFHGKIFEVQIRDGENGPLIAPASLDQWERYGDAATSPGGAPTLYVLNASRSGSAMTYHTGPASLKKETPNYGQVAAIFNDSHNEGSLTGSQWIPPYAAWVAAVLGRLPAVAINVLGQNPHTSAWANEAAYGPDHVTREMELSAAAGAGVGIPERLPGLPR
jgi:hypothetical protein